MEYARAHNKLLLVANSKTALSAMEIAQYAKRGRGQPESNEESSESINARLQQSMYEAMREDLFGRKANKNFLSVLSINYNICRIHCYATNKIARSATNLAFERGPGGGSRLPRPFLFLFRDEREKIPLSQASCWQLEEAARINNHCNIKYITLIILL